MTEAIFPDEFYLEFPPDNVGRVRWLHRVGESPFVLASIEYVKGESAGGSKLWVLELVEEELKPLFPWHETTDKETIMIVELVKKERGL
jgi:hypothetical protein